MSTPNPSPSVAGATDTQRLTDHLGPIAWVIQEVRRAFELSVTSLRRLVHDPDSPKADPIVRPDTPSAAVAIGQLHQVAGVLDVVALPGAARVVRAMESRARTGLESVPGCTPADARLIERAGFAVTEFLGALLSSKPVSAVALFPVYSQLLAYPGAPRAHPADLWCVDWTWQAVQAAHPVPPLSESPALRLRLDAWLLRLVQSGDTRAAQELCAICAGFAAPHTATDIPSFWALAAGFFEALAQARIAPDLHVKRTASRVLMQVAQTGPGAVAARSALGHELLFFCSQAGPVTAGVSPYLAAVHQAWDLHRHPPSDYAQDLFGRHDPALLTRVRKRLVALHEAWSALSGGDSSRQRSTAEQLMQLHDGLVRLHPPLAPLAQALQSLGQELASQPAPPGPPLAMEAATALLYLETLCQDFDPADLQLPARTQRLAQRLDQVRQGATPEPLEPWIEDLFRRASDKQSMGSVVDELHLTLVELEKELDTFFRQPTDHTPLQTIPARLMQMCGVLSVLGLDHAVRAVGVMRELIQVIRASDAQPSIPGAEALAHNLSALGLLVDMLSYQPSLTRQLFTFDEASGELRPVMGRARESQSPRPPQALVPPVVPISPREPAEPPAVPEPSQTPVGWQPPPEPDPCWPLAEEEPVKRIGTLSISLALFNVYLNEADEWSRALEVQMSEWAVEPSQRVPDALVALAHSLGGSSATVGFHALADVARLLELSLSGVQQRGGAGVAHAQAYSAAAQEIRRLLHQFAAGILPALQPQIPAALLALDAQPVVLHLPPASPATASLPVPLRESPPAQADADADADAPEPSASNLPAAAGSETIDPELFVFFEQEALELLPQLSAALRQWQAQTDHPTARDQALRVLHTFKGSARLAGALELGDLAHALESAIQALTDPVSGAAIHVLMQALDGLQSAFEGLVAPPLEPLLPAQAPVLVPVPVPVPDQALTFQAADTDAGTDTAAAVEVPLESFEASPVAAIQPDVPWVPVAVPSSLPRAAGESVRVRTQLLDRLMNQTGEVMISRSRLEAQWSLLRSALQHLTGNLDRLRYQLREIELQSELQMQSRLAREATSDFDPLEFDRFTRVQELTRMMAESVDDVASLQRTLAQTVESGQDSLLAQARQTRALQRDLLQTRMLEFDALADRLHRVLRLSAAEAGKQVQLEIEAGAIEMDRGVLDRMTPAFEHLLRNAVAHGIESPTERVQAGKPATGQMVIRLAQAGNDVAISFADDGAGLDLERIRRKASQMGLVTPELALTDQQVADLIFHPGLSTASEVSTLAGRGIGMDVVRAQVDALGGRIETYSQSGQGTQFKLVLPLTTAVTQVVMLRSGSSVLGVPVGLVEAVLRASAQAVCQATASARFEHAGLTLPFIRAATLLQSAPHADEVPGRMLPVVIVQSASRRLALHVDEVLGQQDVVVKHLGPQLALLPGLVGMTVQPSGEVVLIYNPVALSAVHAQQALLSEAAALTAAASASSPPAGLAAVPLILVVDDSMTVRRVTQRLLQREGYRVALAGDGLQALEQLAQETPAMVLSDIEMPRMDGFDLARNIRNDPRWSELPIVMITSRLAAKHRDHATELGVNHYLGKPYPEQELLGLVQRYAVRACVTPPTS